MLEYSKKNKEKINKTHRESRVKRYRESLPERIRTAANGKVKDSIEKGLMHKEPCIICH